MAVHPNYDNPRVITLTRTASVTAPTDCVGCGEEIDRGRYWALVTGPQDRVDVIAVSHVEHRDDDALMTGCADALRDRWISLLEECRAGLLRRDRDCRKFFVGHRPVSSGTTIELLGSDGHWQAGRFDVADKNCESTPTFRYGIGGWDTPEVSITIPTVAVVRFLPTGRRDHSERGRAVSPG